LKPECYADVDPYFWHYSRAGRESVEGILKGRRGKVVERDIWEFEGSGVELPRIDAYPDDVFFAC
jgi:hypothetical protein